LAARLRLSLLQQEKITRERKREVEMQWKRAIKIIYRRERGGKSWPLSFFAIDLVDKVFSEPIIVAESHE
jgi:hypothetical protein